MESSDRMWSTGEGNGKPLQYSCLEKRQKDRTLKDELPRSVDAQYATGDQWRNNSRNDEVTGRGEFNSDDHYIYYCGQESLRRKEVALIISKRV